MTKSTKTGLTVLISILLAIVLIWWAMRGLDFEKTWSSIKHANYWWVLLSVIMGTLAYGVRSERWKLLIEPMGYEVNSSHSFFAVCMNYFWNLIIPRSGEVARCTTLYTLDKTPVDKSFGTVISERVIDFICLITMGLLTLLFKFDLIIDLVNQVISVRENSNQSANSNTGLIIFVASIILILLLLYFFRNRIKATRFYPKIHQFVYGLRQGLKTIFQLKKRGLFVFYTFLIWLLYYLMTYVVVFALPETSHLSPADGLYLLLVGGIGMVIPASGGIGAFHSAMRLGFIALGLGGEIGVTFGFLVHTPHTMIALTLGLISLVSISIEKSRKVSTG